MKTLNDLVRDQLRSEHPGDREAAYLTLHHMGPIELLGRISDALEQWHAQRLTQLRAAVSATTLCAGCALPIGTTTPNAGGAVLPLAGGPFTNRNG